MLVFWFIVLLLLNLFNNLFICSFEWISIGKFTLDLNLCHWKWVRDGRKAIAFVMNLSDRHFLFKQYHFVKHFTSKWVYFHSIWMQSSEKCSFFYQLKLSLSCSGVLLFKISPCHLLSSFSLQKSDFVCRFQINIFLQ